MPSIARLACHAGCRTDAARRAHHDRLLAVESDPDAVLELFDLAVTWHELEYDGAGMVVPSRWLEFAERHRWQDPDRVARIFGLAVDIALRAHPAPPEAAPLSMASGSGLCPTLVGPAPRAHLSLAPRR